MVLLSLLLLFRCVSSLDRDVFFRECLGVVDCEWCQLEHDGLSALERPFCGTQRMCFAGVLGAKTPYDDAMPVHG